MHNYSFIARFEYQYITNPMILGFSAEIAFRDKAIANIDRINRAVAISVNLKNEYTF